MIAGSRYFLFKSFPGLKITNSGSNKAPAICPEPWSLSVLFIHCGLSECSVRLLWPLRPPVLTLHLPEKSPWQLTILSQDRSQTATGISVPKGSAVNKLPESLTLGSLGTGMLTRQQECPAPLSGRDIYFTPSHKVHSFLFLSSMSSGETQCMEAFLFPPTPSQILLPCDLSHWRPWLHGPCHSYICLYQYFINSYSVH